MSVLRGATDLLASEHPMMLIVEIDDNCEHAGHTRNELFEFIRGFGFTAHLPRAWPLGLELVNELPNSYTDNVVFLRQDRPSSRW